jgi:hypothetical protein
MSGASEGCNSVEKQTPEPTERLVRTMSLMDGSGDTTIAWDDDQDDMLREFIAKKMAEGWSFFIVKPRLGGLIAPKRTKLKSIDDLKETDRAVSVGDADFRKLLASGVDLARRPPGALETIKRAESAAEAASASTIAVRPRAGG